jgi:osmotically-inducible protein OsmY
MKSFGHRFLGRALAGVLGAWTATAALAAPVMPDFKSADSSNAGLVSLQEFAAQNAQEPAFRAGDINRDSHLSNDEYLEAAAYSDRIKAGHFLDDSWITAKIKAPLPKGAAMNGLGVNVETRQGAVRLSGWAKTPDLGTRAEKIALGVEGVKAVRNDLQIRS